MPSIARITRIIGDTKTVALSDPHLIHRLVVPPRNRFRRPASRGNCSGMQAIGLVADAPKC